MAQLANEMPPILISQQKLGDWGRQWNASQNPLTLKAKAPRSFDKQQSVNFASFIDEAFGRSLAKMLGGIPVVKPNIRSLLPQKADCVEVGGVKVIGGVRSQTYDAAYRPDGPRVVFDSKTLNGTKSIAKNWQNMINDLATEATTIHTRFPYAIVGFIVVVPEPALAAKQQFDMVRTLERLATRHDVLDQAHLAEVVALVVWDPATGKISDQIPSTNSILRIEKFSDTLYPQYLNRYKGLPPHGKG